MSMQEIFSPEDLEQLQEHGISMEEAMSQIAAIRDGFPYLDIVASASLEQGIMRVENEQVTSFLNVWEHFLSTAQGKVYKMVPASGAASRMFKDLYSFMDAGYSEPRTDAEKTFFTQINNFAFFDRLNEACLRNEWKPISKLIEAGKHKNIVDNLINEKGLNYGNLPKGCFFFMLTRNPNVRQRKSIWLKALFMRNRKTGKAMCILQCLPNTEICSKLLSIRVFRHIQNISVLFLK